VRAFDDPGARRPATPTPPALLAAAPNVSDEAAAPESQQDIVE